MSDLENNDNVIELSFGSSQPKAAEIPAPSEQTIYDVFCHFIEMGMVNLTLDSRVKGVAVPPHLQEQPYLNLNWSKKFFLPDFVYDEHGVRGSLSFNGVNSFCDIPWQAVWMMRSMVSQEVLPIPEQAPAEIRDRFMEDIAKARIIDRTSAKPVDLSVDDSEVGEALISGEGAAVIAFPGSNPGN